jgi:hypothetical protein
LKSALTLFMAMFNKRRLARSILVGLAFAVLSVSFAISKHIVSSGVTEWITRDHQMRRVLSRAERDNLRIGPALEKDTPLPDSLQQISGVPSSPEIFVAFYSVFAAPLTLIEQKSFVLDRSPVLNL